MSKSSLEEEFAIDFRALHDDIDEGQIKQKYSRSQFNSRGKIKGAKYVSGTAKYKLVLGDESPFVGNGDPQLHHKLKDGNDILVA